ncbi:MAG: substrate-binding domain-containing protein [Acidobacteriota bacterium]|jgi:DNA-binding LacI/PurR family transcriptional regulator
MLGRYMLPLPSCALMPQTPAPTACLAGNDHVALLLLKSLAALKVRVPEQFSVVGFDNLRLVEHLPVPLTTVDQPKQEMGRRAAELLFERVQSGPSLPVRSEVFTPRLVIRESSSISPRSEDPRRGAIQQAVRYGQR